MARLPVGRVVVQFAIDNGFYKVARITGPTHNFLAIRLADASPGDIKLTALGPKDGKNADGARESILNQVKTGLESINAELGKQYAIAEVHYIPSDSVSSSVYKLLTVELIRKIDAGWGS